MKKTKIRRKTFIEKVISAGNKGIIEMQLRSGKGVHSENHKKGRKEERESCREEEREY